MQDAAVQEHFKNAAPFWRNVYEKADVYAIIHQQRRDAVLSIIDGMRPAPGTQVLDIGCGAGTISVPLASRGLCVKAVDATQEMIALTSRFASDSGVSANVDTKLGDIRHLDFADSTFQVVLAIGVLPWLSEHQLAVREMARVLRPGGYLLVNIDNCWGLHRLIDPVTNFILAPLRLLAGRFLRSIHLRKRERGLSTSLMSVRQFYSLLQDGGLTPVQGRSLGFGPFCIFQREFLPVSVGITVHYTLQRLCDRGVPILRSIGGQYIVLARKPEIGS